MSEIRDIIGKFLVLLFASKLGKKVLGRLLLGNNSDTAFDLLCSILIRR